MPGSLRKRREQLGGSSSPPQAAKRTSLTSEGTWIVIEALEDKAEERVIHGTQPRKLWKERDERSSAACHLPSRTGGATYAARCRSRALAVRLVQPRRNCHVTSDPSSWRGNWHEPITQSHTKEAELQKLLAHSLTPPAATGLVRPRRQGGSVVPQRARVDLIVEQAIAHAVRMTTGMSTTICLSS